MIIKHARPFFNKWSPLELDNKVRHSRLNKDSTSTNVSSHRTSTLTQIKALRYVWYIECRLH